MELAGFFLFFTTRLPFISLCVSYSKWSCELHKPLFLLMAPASPKKRLWKMTIKRERLTRNCSGAQEKRAHGEKIQREKKSKWLMISSTAKHFNNTMPRTGRRTRTHRFLSAFYSRETHPTASQLDFLGSCWPAGYRAHTLDQQL